MYGGEKWAEGKFSSIHIEMLCRSTSLELLRGIIEIIKSIDVFFAESPLLPTAVLIPGRIEYS